MLRFIHSGNVIATQPLIRDHNIRPMAGQFQHPGHGRRVAIIAWLVVMAAAYAPADAETSPPVPPSGVAVSAAPIPDPYKLNMLNRTTLIALSQANQTGNYSVLRDLGTPKFQAVNSAARLAEIFTNLRQRNIDLSPVLFFDPKLVRAPALQDDGMLRMTGFFETKPERIMFDMGFEFVAGLWRLSAIVVDIKAPTPAAKQQDQPAKKDAAPKAKEKAKAATKSEPKSAP